MRRNYLCGLVTLALIGVFAAPMAGAADGAEVFAAQKCNMCHAVPKASIEAKTQSVKMKGPDLPNLARDAAWIESYLKREVKLNDADHKMEYKGTAEDLKVLTAWLVALKAE